MKADTIRCAGNGVSLDKIEKNIKRLAGKLRSDRNEIIKRNPDRKIKPLSVKGSLEVAEKRLAEKAFH